jgi:hypothetical protein
MKIPPSSVIYDLNNTIHQPTMKYPVHQPKTKYSTIEQHSKCNLNFKGNTSSKCLQQLVSNIDFEQACDAIIQNKADGNALHDRIYKILKMTTSSLIITGKMYTLGLYVRDIVKEQVDKRCKESEQKHLRKIETYKKIKKTLMKL